MVVISRWNENRFKEKIKLKINEKKNKNLNKFMSIYLKYIYYLCGKYIELNKTKNYNLN